MSTNRVYLYFYPQVHKIISVSVEPKLDHKQSNSSVGAQLVHTIRVFVLLNTNTHVYVDHSELPSALIKRFGYQSLLNPNFGFNSLVNEALKLLYSIILSLNQYQLSRSFNEILQNFNELPIRVFKSKTPRVLRGSNQVNYSTVEKNKIWAC